MTSLTQAFFFGNGSTLERFVSDPRLSLILFTTPSSNSGKLLLKKLSRTVKLHKTTTPSPRLMVVSQVVPSPMVALVLVLLLLHLLLTTNLLMTNHHPSPIQVHPKRQPTLQSPTSLKKLNPILTLTLVVKVTSLMMITRMKNVSLNRMTMLQSHPLRHRQKILTHPLQIQIPLIRTVILKQNQVLRLLLKLQRRLQQRVKIMVMTTTPATLDLVSLAV